jgi:hypothetical protein
MMVLIVIPFLCRIGDEKLFVSVSGSFIRDGKKLDPDLGTVFGIKHPGSATLNANLFGYYVLLNCLPVHFPYLQKHTVLKPNYDTKS